MSAAPQPAADALPALRDDLGLSRSAESPNGEPSWVLHDPLRHRYVQIDALAFAVIRHWREGALPEAIVAAAAASGEGELTVDDVNTVVTFLASNELLALTRRGAWRKLDQAARARKRSIWTRALHNYLFFKAPLLRPDRLLATLAPLLAPLSSPALAWAAVAAALTGVYLIGRQWAEFTGALAQLFSLAGAASFLVAIVVVKIAHEFAHAVAAHRRGLKVPTMGVAVILGMPLLYADVSDVWRLQRRRERIAVALAGIVCESHIAAFATLAWAMLPTGPLRDAMFYLATASWVSSFAINLNPFMRFDGYHLLADLLKVDNLQSRAFALGRWRLREFLFDLREAAPEEFSPGLRFLLIAYAWLTWVYRLVLFFGIALLVYAYFFKLLGLFLFAVEIGWFIVRPLREEVRAWWAKRTVIVTRWRGFVTAAACACLAALLLLPLSQGVRLQGLLEPDVQARLYPPAAAEIASVHVELGQRVAAGDVVFTLRSAVLVQEADLNETRIALANLRLSRLAGDPRARAEQVVLASELDGLLAKRQAIAREVAQLTMRAPIAGLVMGLDPRLHAGRSVARSEMLASIVAPELWVARGYVDEEDAPNLRKGAAGVFVPDDARNAATAVRLNDVADAESPRLDLVMLADTYGGEAPAVLDPRGKLQALRSVYLVHFTVARPPDLAWVHRGVIHVEGARRSYAERAWRRALMILLRESGA